jgi:hypothetical protein
MEAITGKAIETGVLFRDVTIREKIMSDGSRQIERTWQSFHDGSGRELSSENARQVAQTWLNTPREEPLLGYPCLGAIREVFWYWPERDCLNELRLLNLQRLAETQQTNLISDTTFHPQSIQRGLRFPFFQFLRSYFWGSE